MGLPSVFKTKRPAVSSYITLLLSNSNVQAALWQRNNQETTILRKSPIFKYGEDDQAAAQVDKALQDLGKQSEKVNDVIFGLPHTWVDDRGVVAAKKPLLKSITEGLDLNAVGFVVISEALTKYLVAENPRLSMLLIEFSQHELFVSFIDQGKLVGTQYVGRSGETIADMAEALARLNAHQEEEIKLPAKVMTTSLDLDDSELKEQQQLLLAHDWVNSHSFTHPPTVDLLDPKTILEAVVRQESGAASKQPVTKEKIKKPVKITKEAKKEAELAVEIDSKEKGPAYPTSFGIPVKMNSFEKKNKSEIESKDGVDLPSSVDVKKKQSSKVKMKFISWFKEHRSFAIGGFFAGALALLLMVGVWLTTGVDAVVKLSLATELISKETIVILDTSQGGVGNDELVLKAHAIEKNISAKKTKETTGVKVVGDRATGKITLYNKTDGEKVFEKGAKFSKGGLVFTLDEETRVASASDSVDRKEYGKTDANVTAVDIGADSNLEKEAELQVASFDPGTYAASATETFAGGSSREVRVVSLGDQEQLIEELRKKLLTEAEADIEKNLGEGEYLASISIYKVGGQEFDAEIGDEVGVVTLDLTVTVQAWAYLTEDLKPLAQKVLESDVPDGYTLANSEPQIMSAPDQESSVSGEVNLLVNITSEAKPDLNLDELKQEILGKKIDEAIKFLISKEVIKSVEVDLVPSIAARFYAHIPKDASKVEIK